MFIPGSRPRAKTKADVTYFRRESSWSCCHRVLEHKVWVRSTPAYMRAGATLEAYTEYMIQHHTGVNIATHITRWNAEGKLHEFLAVKDSCQKCHKQSHCKAFARKHKL